jgi:hypothetical protein
MTNEIKKQIIAYNCSYQYLMITRYNKIEGREWYLSIILKQLAYYLYMKNTLKVSYKDFTKNDWKH